MPVTISHELEETIQLAFSTAREKRHEFVTLEHVLFALTKDPVAVKVLRGAGADVKALDADLTKFLDQLDALPEDSEAEPQQTAAFWRSLQRAAMHVQSSGKDEVDGGNLLVALYRERESQAIYFLEQQGVRRLDVLNFVSHGIEKGQSRPSSRPLVRRGAGKPLPTEAEGDDTDGEEHVGAQHDADEEEGGDAADDPLAAYTIDLTKQARGDGKTPGSVRLIGRRAGARARHPGARAAPQEQPDLRR